MEKIINVPLYKPPILKEAEEALNKCFSSGWWGYGSACRELENRFTVNRGGWSLATSSCTSALYVIAKLLKHTPDSEVIVPSITWISSAMAFLVAGFKVKVADINPEDLMINVETIKSVVTKNTKAIVVVHLYGQKANAKEISEFCKANGITLIEDCAHRIDIGNIPYADYCCYSFNTVKEVPCGEGGLVWCRKMEEEEQARAISYLGMEVNTWQRTSVTKHRDLIFSNSIGLKLQLNDLSASIANIMFEHKDFARIRRNNIFNIYNEHLQELTNKVKLLQRTKEDSYLMYVISLIDVNRETLREQLASVGISTSVHYPSLTSHPLIEKSNAPIGDSLSKSILTLPCYPDISFDEQIAVINALKKYL